MIIVCRETYMVTFPYPYMNGRLHIGHGFTMLKVCTVHHAHCPHSCLYSVSLLRDTSV